MKSPGCHFSCNGCSGVCCAAIPRSRLPFVWASALIPSTGTSSGCTRSIRCAQSRRTDVPLPRHAPWTAGGRLPDRATRRRDNPPRRHRRFPHPGQSCVGSDSVNGFGSTFVHPWRSGWARTVSADSRSKPPPASRARPRGDVSTPRHLPGPLLGRQGGRPAGRAGEQRQGQEHAWTANPTEVRPWGCQSIAPDPARDRECEPSRPGADPARHVRTHRTAAAVVRATLAPRKTRLAVGNAGSRDSRDAVADDTADGKGWTPHG